MGIDGALPRHGGGDGLAVTVVNGGQNKIDTFLDVDIDYRPVVDGRDVTAHLTVRLHNSAPSDGYPDYVIGNPFDLPRGTNRAIVDIYTPLRFTGAAVDGDAITMSSGTERGWNVYRTGITIEPGATAVLDMDPHRADALRRVLAGAASTSAAEPDRLAHRGHRSRRQSARRIRRTDRTAVTTRRFGITSSASR